MFNSEEEGVLKILCNCYFISVDYYMSLQSLNLLQGSYLHNSREGFEKGIRREVDILTQGIDIWHVMEFDHYLLDESSQGQLHDGDTYVIRWHYIIAQTGKTFFKHLLAVQSFLRSKRFGRVGKVAKQLLYWLFLNQMEF